MTATARILRNAAPVAGRLVPAAVHETDRRVRELLDAAEEDARRLRADAQADRDRVLAEAAEEGRREGLARAAATLAGAAAERDRRLATLEREVASLALDVARVVLGRELSTSPDVVVELAARALAEARDRREVTLRVNPADAAAVRAAEGALAAIPGRALLALREDPAVPRGGAIVETEAGRVDASIETQLAALARALEEVAP